VNVFNKLVVIILLLVLLALSILLALMPVETLRSLQNAMGNAAQWVTTFQSQQPLLFSLGRVALAVFGILIALPLLWQQVKPRRPKSVRVVTESGTQAAVTTDAVQQRLAWHISQLADVVNVEPQVSGGRNGVNIKLKVRTGPEIDVPMKTDEIVGVAKEVVTERMGLRLGKVQVSIDHAPYVEGIA
jgi:predicted membrane protein